MDAPYSGRREKHLEHAITFGDFMFCALSICSWIFSRNVDLWLLIGFIHEKACHEPFIAKLVLR